jgi:predicted RNase H-like HicB family nuclease
MSEQQIEFEREDDGRWIAEISCLPGCLAYGDTQDDAKEKVLELYSAVRRFGEQNDER